MRFQNADKVVSELRIVQFWSEIILVISNARSLDFEFTRMITDQMALHSVQFPLLIQLYHAIILSFLQYLTAA